MWAGNMLPRKDDYWVESFYAALLLVLSEWSWIEWKWKLQNATTEITKNEMKNWKENRETVP